MYSSSRGILYTAPPGPDGSDENRADETTAADDETASSASEAADGVAADD